MKPTLLLILFFAFVSGLDAQEKPNVLFIAVDDLRPELGCYGATQVKTPHLDKLAGQGVLFTRAYCQVPVCGASRASLMTSVLPTRTRFINHETRADVDVPGVATLPQVFQSAGYTTLSNGKIFHDREDTEERSWSEPAWRPSDRESQDPETLQRPSGTQRARIYESPDVADDSYPHGKLGLKTIDDLRRLKKGGKPFFLACGFIKPHMPFCAPKKYWDLYERDKIDIASNRYRPKNAPADLKGSGEFRSYYLGGLDEKSEDFDRMMRHGYMACVSYTDKLIGNVLAELENLGLADNTIVVIWGDHGWHLGEHSFWGKHNTMHLATRVPLIVKAPGRKAGRSASLVEIIDLFPTLCSLAGVAVPETVQGRSFAALLDQPDVSFREVAYSRFGTGDAVITDNFTYTRYSNGQAEMLYDLIKDPDENVNVAGQPEYQETVKMMAGLLELRMEEADRFGKK